MTADQLRAQVVEELEEEWYCRCPYGGRGEGGCCCGSDGFWEAVDRVVEERTCPQS